jgi:adenine-specific DNA-methyltransferase
MLNLGPLFERSDQAISPTSPERRIGKGPAPPPHTPTSAVPHGLLQRIGEDRRRSCAETAQRIADALIPIIGSPFYCREGVLLYHDDCHRVLAALAQAKATAHLTLTSPPYNIGKEYESSLPLADYLNWCARWMSLAFDVTSPRGAFWLNVGYLAVEGKGKAVPIAYLLWDRSQFYLQQEIVWNYGAGVTTKRAFAPRNEKWLFYTKNAEDFVFNLDDVRDPNVKYPNQKKNGKFRCNPLGKNPSDVWQFPKVTSGFQRSSRERTEHPAQFPLGVVDRIVKVSSNYGDLVIDPFSGSGSTGIAAVGNGRVYLGVELREDYCRASAARFDSFLRLRDTSAEQEEFALL